MAIISGRVIFDRDRSASISAGDTGIEGVQIVLQNVSNENRLVVLTDEDGNYTFLNVPDGEYRLVESFGSMGGVPTPGDFNEAELGSIPQGINPPISSIINPPAGSTNLDSLTPDTLFITVTGANISDLNFLNGPVIYTPIEALLDECVVISGENLITAADDGTFGSFEPGTEANLGAPELPYPGVTPDFIYVLPNPEIFAPLDGEYTIQNIMTNSMSASIGAWWRIADHTVGNETGRMMIVNGFNPGAVFFRQTVSVNPDTNYLFTAWILNLFKVTGFPNPELSVQILDYDGNVLYRALLGVLIPVNTNAPQWKQIGSVINSQNNNILTVEFISEGPEVIGNDYAIDDIEFHEVLVPEFTPIKSIEANTIDLGETIEYTVTLQNTCTQPLTDVFFRDIVPTGLSFVSGSVIINGTSMPLADPNMGFGIPDIPGNETVTVIFSVRADFIPEENPTINHANMLYSFTPVEGGIPQRFEVVSNDVLVLVGTLADIAVRKTADTDAVTVGSVLTYRIIVSNAGPSRAQNVVLTDDIPEVLSNVEFSVNGGNDFRPWQGSLHLGNFVSGESQTILIRGIVTSDAAVSLANTAEVRSDTPDPDLSNNISTVTVRILTPRCRALIDIVQSIALQEAAAARILDAEGAKLQALIDMEDLSSCELIEANENMRRLVGSITRLDAVLQDKLTTVSFQLENCNEDEQDNI